MQINCNSPIKVCIIQVANQKIIQFVIIGRCEKIGTSDITSIKKILLCKFLFFLFKYYQYVLGKI
jgi:hypothetical protein